MVSASLVTTGFSALSQACIIRHPKSQAERKGGVMASILQITLFIYLQILSAILCPYKTLASFSFGLLSSFDIALRFSRSSDVLHTSLPPHPSPFLIPPPASSSLPILPTSPIENTAKPPISNQRQLESSSRLDPHPSKPLVILSPARK